LIIWLTRYTRDLRRGSSPKKVSGLALTMLSSSTFRRGSPRHQGRQVRSSCCSFLDISHSSCRYWARVLSTHMPKSSSSSEPHYVGGDLRLDNEQACQADPPDQYIYNIQILEEVTAAAASTQTAPRPEDGSTKWSGSIMEVHCKIMR
jgi:hypothetical protein